MGAASQTAASGSSYYFSLFGQNKPSTQSLAVAVIPATTPHPTSIIASPVQDRDSVVTLTSSSPQHQLEQRNSRSIPGRQPCVVFISSLPNRTACSVSSTEILLLHSSCVPLAALSAVHDVEGCDGRSKDCHSSRGLASLAGENSILPAPDEKHLNPS